MREHDDELARACGDEELSERARHALATYCAARAGMTADDAEVLTAVRDARRYLGTSEAIERAVGRALRARS